jgi:hypothetical protein
VLGAPEPRGSRSTPTLLSGEVSLRA